MLSPAREGRRDSSAPSPNPEEGPPSAGGVSSGHPALGPGRLTRMDHTHGLPCSVASSWVQPMEPWPQIRGRENVARSALLWLPPCRVSSGRPGPTTKGHCSSRDSFCPRDSLLSCGLAPPLVLSAWGGHSSTASIPESWLPLALTLEINPLVSKPSPDDLI